MKEEYTSKPILSVCIPTYNRAEMLRSALLSVMPQIAELGGEVELLVSDNCSEDHTPDVVKSALKSDLIKYFRAEENKGSAWNFDNCAQIARGEYAWIVGDDDIIREGGLKRLLDVLKANPDTDYVFVNTTERSIDERKALNRPATGADFPELLPVWCSDMSERRLGSWNELIDPNVNGVFLGTIMSSVFRRKLWVEASREVNLHEPFPTTLPSVYSHAMILGRSMVGHRAVYLGYPCLIAFEGHHEWKGCVPLIFALWLHELLDEYERLGVETWRIEKCRRTLLMNSGGALVRMILRRGIQGRECFSLRRHMRRFARYPELWFGLFAMPLMRRFKSVFTRS